AADSTTGRGQPDPERAGPPRLPFTAGHLPMLTRFAPDQHTLRGTVTVARTAHGPCLQTEALAEHVLFYFPGPALLASYEFEADVTRLEGEGGFFFVLPVLGRSAALVIDGGDDLGHRTGLVAVDNQVLSSPRYPTPLATGTQLPPGRRVRLACGVDAQGLRLRVDGNEVYRWQGDPARLSLPPFYRSPHKAYLHAGSFHSRFRLEGVALRMGHAALPD
ncbi:MAG: hypothetical protein J5I93_28495, partial [Pirellulaceae bacterium]|nr:hypothetical protein [Pirellulaceae bacterium]